MRFTASATDYDFDRWKVKINESTQRRSRHLTKFDKTGIFKKIGQSYILSIEFFDLDSTDKSNLVTIFQDDYGDLTAISNIDEVASGQTYYTYSSNMYISNPQQNLIFTRSTDKKQIDNWTAKMTVICDTYATATKP